GARVRRPQAAAEPELLAQPDAVGLLGENRIRSGVDGEAVDLFAGDHAAGPRAALEDDERDAARPELVRRRKTGDAGADDDGVDDHSRLRTRSSSASMKVADVLSDSVRRDRKSVV